MRVFLFLLLIALPLSAGTIDDFALGSSLAGATVDVIRVGGIHSTATFVADGSGAVATALGSGGFTLTVSPGDTSLATWTLTNTDPSLIFFNNITAVTIDLTFSGVSLFDSGSLPSTPDSGPGIPGVIYLAGNGIGGAAEFVPWGDPSNEGDMYFATTITFSVFLGPSAFSSWMDDTDVIATPEPESLGMVGFGLGFVSFIRGRRASRRQPSAKNVDRKLGSD